MDHVIVTDSWVVSSQCSISRISVLPESQYHQNLSSSRISILKSQYYQGQTKSFYIVHVSEMIYLPHVPCFGNSYPCYQIYSGKIYDVLMRNGSATTVKISSHGCIRSMNIQCLHGTVCHCSICPPLSMTMYLPPPAPHEHTVVQSIWACPGCQFPSTQVHDQLRQQVKTPPP